MTSLKTSIKTITYLSDIGCLEIQGASLWGKLDNVFGCTSIDECFAVFNGILCSLGLPPFSKGTRFKLRQLPDNSVCGHIWNGAIIRETHINSNYSVGYNNEKPFIRGVSTLPYRNSLPR
ncbi:TPA: hypothetical protein ACOX9D_004848, partial [Escherichia coli]